MSRNHNFAGSTTCDLSQCDKPKVSGLPLCKEHWYKLPVGVRTLHCDPLITIDENSSDEDVRNHEGFIMTVEKLLA